ncbi:MAG TPA: hypothetical protein V6C76_03985 [Drouetiella sp.]
MMKALKNLSLVAALLSFTAIGIDFATAKEASASPSGPAYPSGQQMQEKLWAYTDSANSPQHDQSLGGARQFENQQAKTTEDFGKMLSAKGITMVTNIIPAASLKINADLGDAKKWADSDPWNDPSSAVERPTAESSKINTELANAELVGKLSDPQRWVKPAQAAAQAQATNAGNACAEVSRDQASSAIDFCARYLSNFTVDGSNKWNMLRNAIFVPMAILLLLPGAVLTQVRAIMAAGNPVMGNVNPFEGILRAVIAIFLIPGTYLVVNYSIDLSNSITYTINSEYFRLFGSDMYKDAICAEIRAFPVRGQQENRNALDLPVPPMTPMVNPSGLFSQFEGMMENKIEDPCSGIYQAPQGRADEAMSSASVAARLGLNGSNAALTASWNILCAFQMAYLYYLWFVGPVAAGLWVWPMKQLRGALPSWVEGVVTLAFWSLFWNTSILLIACFKGTGETGSVLMTALHFLATASVKHAFDFAGLVRAAGMEAANMAEKAMKSGGAGGGGAGGGSGGGSCGASKGGGARGGSAPQTAEGVGALSSGASHGSVGALSHTSASSVAGGTGERGRGGDGPVSEGGLSRHAALASLRNGGNGREDGADSARVALPPSAGGDTRDGDLFMASAFIDAPPLSTDAARFEGDDIDVLNSELAAADLDLTENGLELDEVLGDEVAYNSDTSLPPLSTTGSGSAGIDGVSPDVDSPLGMEVRAALAADITQAQQADAQERSREIAAAAASATQADARATNAAMIAATSGQGNESRESAARDSAAAQMREQVERQQAEVAERARAEQIANHLNHLSAAVEGNTASAGSIVSGDNRTTEGMLARESQVAFDLNNALYLSASNSFSTDAGDSTSWVSNESLSAGDFAKLELAAGSVGVDVPSSLAVGATVADSSAPLVVGDSSIAVGVGSVAVNAPASYAAQAAGNVTDYGDVNQYSSSSPNVAAYVGAVSSIESNGAVAASSGAQLVDVTNASVAGSVISNVSSPADFNTAIQDRSANQYYSAQSFDANSIVSSTNSYSEGVVASAGAGTVSFVDSSAPTVSTNSFVDSSAPTVSTNSFVDSSVSAAAVNSYAASEANSYVSSPSSSSLTSYTASEAPVNSYAASAAPSVSMNSIVDSSAQSTSANYYADAVGSSSVTSVNSYSDVSSPVHSAAAASVYSQATYADYSNSSQASVVYTSGNPEPSTPLQPALPNLVSNSASNVEHNAPQMPPSHSQQTSEADYSSQNTQSYSANSYASAADYSSQNTQSYSANSYASAADYSSQNTQSYSANSYASAADYSSQNTQSYSANSYASAADYSSQNTQSYSANSYASAADYSSQNTQSYSANSYASAADYNSQNTQSYSANSYASNSDYSSQNVHPAGQQTSEYYASQAVSQVADNQPSTQTYTSPAEYYLAHVSEQRAVPQVESSNAQTQSDAVYTRQASDAYTSNASYQHVDNSESHAVSFAPVQTQDAQYGPQTVSQTQGEAYVSAQQVHGKVQQAHGLITRMNTILSGSGFDAPHTVAAQNSGTELVIPVPKKATSANPASTSGAPQQNPHQQATIANAQALAQSAPQKKSLADLMPATPKTRTAKKDDQAVPRPPMMSGVWFDETSGT